MLHSNLSEWFMAPDFLTRLPLQKLVAAARSGATERAARFWEYLGQFGDDMFDIDPSPNCEAEAWCCAPT